VPDELFDESYAREQVEGLVGDGMQVPPVYSAIKIDGKKSYEAARKGNVLEIEPRPFTVHSAQFDGLETVTEDDQRYPIWHMTLHVSKGTYLRSIARDLGRNLGTAAHCAALRRVAVGNLGIDECLSLEEFDKNPMDALVDPLRLLRLRWSFLRDQDKALACGQPIGEEHVRLNEPVEGDMFDAGCCTSSVYPSCGPAQPGEVVGFVVGHELKALYEYDESKHRYKPRCVFPQGVERGTGL
jgi:tRNA pseudouridine55 synthase